MMRLNSNVKWLPGSGMKVSFFSHCDLARCCVCALGTILLNFIAHDDRGQILSEKNSYQLETSCMKIASITIVFFLGRNLGKYEAGNGQRIISSYVISLSNFLIMEKYMRKLREWLNLQQQKKKRKKRNFCACFIR